MLSQVQQLLQLLVHQRLVPSENHNQRRLKGLRVNTNPPRIHVTHGPIFKAPKLLTTGRHSTSSTNSPPFGNCKALPNLSSTLCKLCEARLALHRLFASQGSQALWVASMRQCAAFQTISLTSKKMSGCIH